MSSLCWRYFSLLILCVFFTDFETPVMAQEEPNYSLVYVFTKDGTPDIYRLSLLDGEPTRLTSGGGDNYNIAVSPDNTRIAFNSNRDGYIKIYVMNADGSEQVNLTRSDTNEFLSGWSPDGTQLLFVSAPNEQAGLFTLDLATNQVERLTDPNKYVVGGVWSPDGAAIAYFSGRESRQLCVLTIETEESNCIVNTIYITALPQWSLDGSDLLIEGLYQQQRTYIYLVNTDGTEFRRLSPEGSFQGGANWSPDGTQIAFHEVDRTSEFPFTDIFVMNADGTDPVQLTDAPGPDSFPAWSPDGSQIAFYAARDGNGEIYVMDVDGSNQRRLTFTTGEESEIHWIASLQP